VGLRIYTLFGLGHGVLDCITVCWCSCGCTVCGVRQNDRIDSLLSQLKNSAFLN